MKRHAAIVGVLALLVSSFAAYPHSNGVGVEEYKNTIDAIIEEIREEQELKENEPIELTEVESEKLEELGEAVMSMMHPDLEEHAWIDEMMGGEGSVFLSAMHRMMGYQYLNRLYGYGARDYYHHGVYGHCCHHW